MPGAVIVHAAVFTAGAVIGGGLATVIASKKAATAAPVPVAVPAPAVVQVESGRPRFQPSSQVAVLPSQTLPPVLKNGHPGKLNLESEMGVN